MEPDAPLCDPPDELLPGPPDDPLDDSVDDPPPSDPLWLGLLTESHPHRPTAPATTAPRIDVNVRRDNT